MVEERLDNFWRDKRILVTGGRGFLGRYVVEKLKQKPCRKLFAPEKKEYDLLSIESSEYQNDRLMEKFRWFFKFKV